MYSKYFRLLSVVTILLLVSMACNLGTSAGATATPASTTEIGKDVPTATDTELPTETATIEPSITPTETPALEPSVTPTAEPPVARVIKEINCRVGPGGAYNLVTTFRNGDVVDVIARDLGGGFVFVRNPADPEQGCWVLENGLQVSGNITPLPAYTPPPSPTLAPNFTVTYKNIDTCKGDPYIRFVVVNTGNFAFRSAYIKVTNLRSQESTEQAVIAFDMTDGCAIVKLISPLGLGQTGYLQNPVFRKSDPKGQKMSAVFQLCTEQGLKGFCVTQSLQFTAK